jgi:hypothetical protein
MSHTLGVENKQPSNYWFVIPHSFNSQDFKYNPINLNIAVMKVYPSKF